MDVDKDTKLGEILEKQEAAKVLAQNKVPCLGCPMANIEMDQITLAQICEAYGLDYEKIKEDLKEV